MFGMDSFDCLLAAIVLGNLKLDWKNKNRQ